MTLHLTSRLVLETALWIQFCDKKSLDVDFLPERIRIHLPPKHLLSMYCSASPGEMAVVLDDMERQHLIHKEERVGIWTAPGGNRIVADIIEKRYRKQARALLGREMLLLLLERLRVPLPEPVMDTFTREDEISPPSRSP